jgi:hypothetical protein
LVRSDNIIIVHENILNFLKMHTELEGVNGVMPVISFRILRQNVKEKRKRRQIKVA